MEAAANTRLSSVNPIDATDWERQCSTQLGDRKLAAGVTALRNIDELD
jgi:hypothetical protein